MNARGVTLVEMLAALVLLTTLAVASVGFVRNARIVLTKPAEGESTDVARARWLADRLAERPALFGISTAAGGPRTSSGRLAAVESMPAWSADAQWTAHRSGSLDVRHAWLELNLHGSIAWVAIPLDEPSGDIAP